VSTRSRVRHFAVELSESPALATIEPRLDFPVPGISQADKLDALGLRSAGGALANAAWPMTTLLRPGVFAGAQSKLLKLTNGTNFKLWGFDERGRAVDPGAVAAWWGYLAATSFNNLWADGITGALQRTAVVAPRLTVHLVNAHEGPLADPLLARIQAGNLTPATGIVRAHGGGAGAAMVGFTPTPTSGPDDAPLARAAMLPHGRYTTSVSLWASGPVHASLARDYVRVGVVEVERHLVGQPRVAAPGASAGATRRAADQQRASTRVAVARAASGDGTPILQATIDDAADKAIDVFAGSDPVSGVAAVLDRDWGPLAASLPAVALPDTLPAPTVRALAGGGGTAPGGTVANQRVLIEMAFDVSLAGCWVRAWSQGFDFARGVHTALDGGAGAVRADGTVSLVVLLPDGEAQTRPLGVNVIVAAQAGAKLYPEVRFDRPLPIGGAPIAVGAATGQIVVCELGQTFANAAALASVVPPGATLFSRQAGTPALIDRDSLPASAFVTRTAIRQLSAGDRIDLTQPAFRDAPDGATPAALAASGATVTRTARTGLTRLTAPGQPLPTQERLEIAFAGVGAAGARAAVLTAPTLGRFHELLPHQSGHPGAPAAPELHGTGAALSGPAAVLVAEHVRERVNASTADLTAAAATPFATPAEPVEPSAWAAVLKTVAAGTEGEVQLASLVRSQSYPFDDTFANKRTWFTSRMIGVPDVSGAANQASAVRALDRRALAAGFGLREAATSLAAAFGRAEDLVYVETPALDDGTLGESGDTVAVWTALRERMDAVPSLRVVLCVPIALGAGTPEDMTRVRNGKLLEAIQALQGGEAPEGVAGRAERAVVFAPSAGPRRNLRLAATTVIVDDVYALTGTTHLWRRGLSFDSSMAVALFDESLSRGRSREIRRFRRALIGGRLGLATTLVPDDPAELVRSIQMLLARGSTGSRQKPSRAGRARDGNRQRHLEPGRQCAGGVQPGAVDRRPRRRLRRTLLTRQRMRGRWLGALAFSPPPGQAGIPHGRPGHSAEASAMCVVTSTDRERVARPALALRAGAVSVLVYACTDAKTEVECALQPKQSPARWCDDCSRRRAEHRILTRGDHAAGGVERERVLCEPCGFLREVTPGVRAPRVERLLELCEPDEATASDDDCGAHAALLARYAEKLGLPLAAVSYDWAAFVRRHPRDV
jgi:hypothetical protein